ncbi:MAG TPA: vWA domain-containing protein [Planctomycetaceae bacterium]|jgi:Flp pilus assembly protein TadG
MRNREYRRAHASRRGAIAPTIAVLLPVLVVLIGFAVNVAYMEMTRTQLRISCDAAAKAGLVSLGATQQTTTAQTAARTLATANPVAGQALQLANSNIEFGNAAKNGSGVYVFTSGASPLNSSRVTGTMNVPYLFGAFMPGGNFAVTEVSVATRISHDIMLVLDRSASMAFDLSANEFSYPSDRSTYTTLQAYFTPPSPTGSRWYALTNAVNSFVSVLQSRNLDVHLGLVTYAENYTLGNYSATEATLDVPLTSNYAKTATAMNVYGQTPLLGDTNITAGLTMAQTELTGSDARVTANRTIILLTDGVVTTGNLDFASVAQTARTSSQIVTYTIAFGGEAGTGSIEAEMAKAAQNGNGTFYNAPTAAALTQAFQIIADSLPAVLIK